MLQNFRIEGTIIALSPIHHGGNEKTGASQLLRRQKFFVNGESKEIPIISGNAVRGYTRRLVMDDLLKRVDFKITNLSFYHSLFSGGVLEQKGKAGYLNLELRKKTRELLPALSLYGASYGNQILPGKMKVKELLPLCEEMTNLVPKKFTNYCKHDIYTFLDHTFFTRKEDLGTAGLEKQEKDPTVQMIVDVEIFSPGTIFYHGFSLEKATEIEISCLGHVISLWQNSAYIGGKSSSGFGEIRIEYEEVPSPKPYLDFIEQNKQDIRSLLEELNNL